MLTSFYNFILIYIFSFKLLFFTTTCEKVIAAIPQMNELNIGHSIIARAIFTGLPEAVKTMKEIMEKARNNSQK